MWEIRCAIGCSTLITSQLPITQWHKSIGDATLADGETWRDSSWSAGVELRPLDGVHLGFRHLADPDELVRTWAGVVLAGIFDDPADLLAAADLFVLPAAGPGTVPSLLEATTSAPASPASISFFTSSGCIVAPSVAKLA